MRFLFLLLLLIFVNTSAQAQIQGEDEVYLNADLLEPEFPGGMDMFYTYLMARLDKSKIKPGEKLLVSFLVNKEGGMEKIKLLKFDDMDTAVEILRALKNFPKWKPAHKNGNPVGVELKIPIIFN
ncbi:energy transducer TonB [Flavobacterium azooxidireducens]|uniref:Energy transducer TonB n=1 Tax=Flavobacterium azooxidireducens TaxID=1871076 RepID=A0ABY4KG93_9FLAO|nr:energy transducer TonB [Flavobacterium azooxidireducens]UPQ79820.1 energy transducer TonB [Flavobacterium azooxidireducens]